MPAEAAGRNNRNMDFLHLLDPLLRQFLGTILLGFLVGLEYHGYMREKGYLGFGTTRTLTLLSVLGFVLAALDARLGSWLLPAGLLVVAGYLGIYYLIQARRQQFSLMGPLIGLLSFLIGPVMIHFPSWFWLLFVIVIIMMLGQKPLIRSFSDLVPGEELLTLSKFLLMAGVVLPLLPDRQIASWVPVSWYKLWLAVVVVSGFSYLSYLAQTWFFPRRGLLLSGILGGLYSSTATTWVLARRSAAGQGDPWQARAAIVLATAMMYPRLWVIIALMAPAVAMELTVPFLLFMLLSLGVGGLLARQGEHEGARAGHEKVSHPLELTTALLFAALFVLFSALTHLVLQFWGIEGLNRLAFVAGLADVDPFVLSVLSGTYSLDPHRVVGAILIASGSNDLLKGIYALVLGGRMQWLPALWLLGLCLASVGWAFFLL
ncbi:MAG: DUF4010 domain-containing protein [Gammaproteobacteria bacterium]|nr:MAG: DUF4010 domain-containing protein [Gammaproteobacteria bacterium]